MTDKNIFSEQEKREAALKAIENLYANPNAQHSVARLYTVSRGLTQDSLAWIYERVPPRAIYPLIQNYGLSDKDGLALSKNPNLNSETVREILINDRFPSREAALDFFLNVSDALLEDSLLSDLFNSRNEDDVWLTARIKKDDIIAKTRSIHEVDDAIPDAYLIKLFLAKGDGH